MATKSILLAIADSQAIAQINDTLGSEWVTTPANSENDALALLASGSFDALLVDFNLGDPDSSDLLNLALKRHPQIARFLLAYEADLALIAAKVCGDHEILSKPIEPASLQRRIENGMKDSQPQQAAKPYAAKAPDFEDEISHVYAEVLQALDSSTVSCRQLGAIIARDASLTRELLQLTRSAYLGLPSNLTNPVEAVEVLGLETVKAVVLARRFLAGHARLNPCYLSLEKLWQHSVNVAQIARDLVLFETRNRVLASQALAAGLLHDLGKIVLAANYEDLYGRVHSLARKQPVALWDVEKEMFGANHGEIGACLLGMWNLPGDIVDAAAFHHDPPVGEHDHLTPLAAVHIANVLEHQFRPVEEFRVVPVMNAPFLNQLGLLQRLPVWRATFAKQLARVESGDADRPVSTMPLFEDSQTGSLLPGPVAATWTTTSSPADQASRAKPRIPPRRWIFTGALAGVLFMLAALLRSELNSDEPLRVHARGISTPAAISTDASIPSAPLPPALELLPVTANVSQETAQPDSWSDSNPVIAAEHVELEFPPASISPRDKGASFRLNGIIYSASRPSAIINGKTVFVGEGVDGVTIISIGMDEVVVELDGERNTVRVPGSDGHF